MVYPALDKNKWSQYSNHFHWGLFSMPVPKTLELAWKRLGNPHSTHSCKCRSLCSCLKTSSVVPLGQLLYYFVRKHSALPTRFKELKGLRERELKGLRAANTFPAWWGSPPEHVDKSYPKGLQRKGSFWGADHCVLASSLAFCHKSCKVLRCFSSLVLPALRTLTFSFKETAKGNSS